MNCKTAPSGIVGCGRGLVLARRSSLAAMPRMLCRSEDGASAVRLLAILAAMLSVAASSPALAQCATITGSVAGGCRVLTPSQVFTIQSGGTLNGWINMTGLAPGAALIVDAGGTLNAIHGAPSLNGGGQATNTIVALAGANQTITNNGTITFNQNVNADLIGIFASGFTITNNGQIINNDPATVSNAISVNTANVSGTINNYGLITAAGGSNEGTIYAPAAGGTLAINNFQGATIHSNSFIAVNSANSTTMTVRNAGTISTGSLVAPAIQFGTGNDTLILEGTSVITGFVNGRTGINTLALGGTANGSFDVSLIGAAAQFRNFQTFQKIEPGTWTITGVQAGNIPWSIYDGTFAVAAGANTGPGTIDVIGGTLAGVGTVGPTTLQAGGTIAPGIDGIGTLTINGNYSGSGGTLAIQSQLGGDAAPADLLRVNGDTSGNTTLRVANTGGLGAVTVEGIKVVDVVGASNGAFTLQGDYVFQGRQAVVGGAYAYRLYQGGINSPADGDWYLRSSLIPPPPGTPADARLAPLYQPGVPLYEAYPQVLLELNGLSTMRQRIGDRYDHAGNAFASLGAPNVDGQGPEVQAWWGRMEGWHGHVLPRTSTAGTTTDTDQARIQTGLDGLLKETDAGRWMASLYLQYGAASSKVRSFFGNGTIKVEGYSVAGTLTWLGNNGFYVDAQAQATLFDSTLHSTTAGYNVVNNDDPKGYALGVEAGWRVPMGGAWSLTPQVQLVYSKVDFDFSDVFGASVLLDDGDSLTGRGGIAAEYQSAWIDPARGLINTSVYGIANLYYEFLDGTQTNVGGVSFANAADRLWGGLGGGGSYAWANGRYALYAEALVTTSLDNFSDSYGYKGTTGFRMRW